MKRRQAENASLGTALAVLVLCTAHRVAGAEPVPTDIAFDCVVMPDVVVDVSAGAGGLIERLHVDRGDHVKKGQVLVELESGVERASLALASARAGMESEIGLMQVSLDFDARRRERSEALYARSAISPHEKENVAAEEAMARWRLQQAEDKRRLAELETRRASEMLKLRTIVSPIDGVVVERFRSPGEYVEDEPILRVAQLDPLAVEVIVPVAMHGSVRPGMRAEVQPEIAAAQRHAASVRIVDPVADPASATFRARLELPNPDLTLLGGVKCMARLLPDAAEEPPVRAAAATPQVAMQDAHEVVRTAGSVPASGCLSVGPIDEPAAADNVAMRLKETGFGSAQREMQLPVTVGYIVVSPPQATGSEAMQLEHSLRARGISDVAVMGRGPYERRVSFGVYANHRPAQARKVSLETSGVDADVLPREALRTRIWLDLEWSGQDTQATVRKVLRKIDPDLGTEAGPCPAPITAQR